MNTIIGVLIGFGLSLLKDYLMNKPHLVVQKNSGSILFCQSNMYNEKEYTENIDEANKVEVKSLLQIYNKGKAPTAIKGISIILKLEEKIIATSFPETIVRIEKGKRESLGTAFNIQQGTIEVIEVVTYFEIGKEDYEVPRYLASVNELDATIIVVDIEDKKIKIDI